MDMFGPETIRLAFNAASEVLIVNGNYCYLIEKQKFITFSWIYKRNNYHLNGGKIRINDNYSVHTQLIVAARQFPV